jgi:predicted secreted protein
MYNGALMQLKINLGEHWQVVGGMKTTRFEISGDLIEANVITGNDWRILAEGGFKKINISLSGLFTNNEAEKIICKLAFSGRAEKYKLEFANNESLEGHFQIASYIRFGDVNKEEEYSISLASSSAIEYKTS